MIADTSLKAWLNEVAPTLGPRYIQILEVFEQKPGRDFSNAELGRALGWEINRVTPRVHELRGEPDNKGHRKVPTPILELSRRRKCEVTGREVMAWKVVDKPVIPPRAISPAPTRYQMPSLSQPGETHKIVASAAGVTCPCPGFTYRGTCFHVRALMRGKPKQEDTTKSLFAV